MVFTLLRKKKDYEEAQAALSEIVTTAFLENQTIEEDTKKKLIKSLSAIRGLMQVLKHNPYTTKEKKPKKNKRTEWRLQIQYNGKLPPVRKVVFVNIKGVCDDIIHLCKTNYEVVQAAQMLKNICTNYLNNEK